MATTKKPATPKTVNAPAAGKKSKSLAAAPQKAAESKQKVAPKPSLAKPTAATKKSAPAPTAKKPLKAVAPATSKPAVTTKKEVKAPAAAQQAKTRVPAKTATPAATKTVQSAAKSVKPVQPVKVTPAAKKKTASKAVAAPAPKPTVKPKTVVKPAVASKAAKAPVKKTAPPKMVTVPAAPTTKVISTKWNDVRTILVSMREETLKEIMASVKKGSETPIGEEPTGDIYDQASSERDRELGLLLNDREREKLHNIDEALLRIAEGDYGICEECDEEIPMGRLKVMPFTRHCVRCKSDLEKFQAQTRRIEEDRTYREIPVNDEDEV